MKKYIIKKLAYADNINELQEMFQGGETLSIELQDDFKDLDIGFNRNNEE